jgi:hypothetical protein
MVENVRTKIYGFGVLELGIWNLSLSLHEAFGSGDQFFPM